MSFSFSATTKEENGLIFYKGQIIKFSGWSQNAGYRFNVAAQEAKRTPK